jgi:hypothetical protein
MTNVVGCPSDASAILGPGREGRLCGSRVARQSRSHSRLASSYTPPFLLLARVRGSGASVVSLSTALLAALLVARAEWIMCGESRLFQPEAANCSPWRRGLGKRGSPICRLKPSDFRLPLFGYYAPPQETRENPCDQNQDRRVAVANPECLPAQAVYGVGRGMLSLQPV